MFIKRVLFITILSLGYILNVTAYKKDSIQYNVEMSGTFSNGEFAPLWATANRFGLGSVESNNGFLRAGMQYNRSMKRNWELEAGLDLAGGVNMTSDFRVQQAYMDVSWKCLNLSIGSKERYGFPLEKNSMLTSGWMVEGPNARPVPQVRGEIKDYWNVPGTGKWLALKGHIAYGKFMDDGWQRNFVGRNFKYTQNSLYHSKSLMFRLGNEEKFPLSFEFGILMATQFAGDQFLMQSDGTPKLITDMPDDLGAFWAAFFPTAGGDDTPAGEQVNVEGNMLGSWNFALNYRWGDWRVRATLDHYFEDHSQMFWEYGRWKDGQIGIELYLPKNRWVTSVLWEGISTKDSSGPVLYDGFWGSFSDIQWSCGDDYYNNHIYQAWQHYGLGMGHPFLPGPGYNKDGEIGFKSNRMKGQHWGIMGNPNGEWNWRILASFYRHWGTYSKPFEVIKHQFSGLAEVGYTPTRLDGWNFSAAFVMDRGEFPGNSTGMMLSVRKTGKFVF